MHSPMHPVCAAITSLAVVESRGLVVGTTAPATTMPHAPATAFVFDLAERQVIKTLSLCSPGTPLAGDPEAHGVVHITTARDGDVYAAQAATSSSLTRARCG